MIHLQAKLPGTPQQAFERFLDPASWLCAEAEVEPRAGGKYELYWDPADRSDNNTEGCRITAFLPGELLAFTWKGPSRFQASMNAIDPPTHVVVSFIPAAGGTHVHLVHTGWVSTPEGQEARAWFERAWGLAFAQLTP